MDHLISIKGKSRIEKGPLFKILPSNISKLIPIIEKVNLTD